MAIENAILVEEIVNFGVKLLYLNKKNLFEILDCNWEKSKLSNLCSESSMHKIINVLFFLV